MWTSWGTTGPERERTYPCDRFVAGEALYRGVTVRAPRAEVYRWLCQLKLAPYSYDWIDNLGRQSPRRLIEGCEQLELGQRFMFIFHLVDFEPGVQLTLAVRLPGSSVLTYALTDCAEGCRLVAKLVVRYPRGPVGWAMRLLLPPGDLVMMRRQLLNLKVLSEG